MQVTLPEMGESVTEGTVAKWLKQPGDAVREGAALVEGTTDKVDAEVPAPASGRLLKILADAGQTITVGAALAEIEVGGDGDVARQPKPEQAKPAQPDGPPKAANAPPTAPANVSPVERSAPNGGAAVEVSEGAELLARSRGVDLNRVKGSGPGGSIRRRDVMDAIEAEPTPTPTLSRKQTAEALSPTARAPSPTVPADPRAA